MILESWRRCWLLSSMQTCPDITEKWVMKWMIWLRGVSYFIYLWKEKINSYIYMCVCVLLTVSCPPLFFFVHPPQLPGNESFSESAFCTVKHNGALEWCCDANIIKFSFLCSRKQWRCYEKKIMAGTSIAEGGVFESRILSKSTCTESNQRIVTMVV